MVEIHLLRVSGDYASTNKYTDTDSSTKHLNLITTTESVVVI